MSWSEPEVIGQYAVTVLVHDRDDAEFVLTHSQKLHDLRWVFEVVAADQSKAFGASLRVYCFELDAALNAVAGWMRRGPHPAFKRWTRLLDHDGRPVRIGT